MMHPTDFDILLEDGPCLLVNKPSGVLTQAPPGVDSLEVRVKRFIKERDEKPGGVYLGVPHRLDRPVSGAMVLAKHVRAARRISEQFEARTLRKVYWACVAGRVEPAEGIWRDWLRKIPGVARAEVVEEANPDARQAVLHYRTLGPFKTDSEESGTWLEIELETGRTHQIRVQAASRGHSIIGDEMYGSDTPFGPRHDDRRQRPIALHARRLELRHPMTREPVSADAPLPIVWQSLGLSLSPGDLQLQ
jgi:RluA family pseudouridine synthase